MSANDPIEVRTKLINLVGEAANALESLTQIGSADEMWEYPVSSHAQVQNAIEHLRKGIREVTGDD